MEVEGITWHGVTLEPDQIPGIDDIDAASAELEAAGFEFLCDLQRIPEMNYAYRHFRGPDGRVFGINEQK